MFPVADLSLEFGNQNILNRAFSEVKHKMEIREHHKLFEETIEFRGHPNIRGSHRNTIEVTKEPEISVRADCIIGVKASASCNDLSQEMKDHIRSGGSLVFEVKVASETFTFSGRGIKGSTLASRDELVLRRSEFQSDRTVAGRCDAAAIDIPRTIVAELRNPSTRGLLVIKAMSDADSS